MKKIVLTMLAATAMLFTVESVTAQVYEEAPTQQPEIQEQKEDMEKIEVQELPDKVQQAVERDFQGSSISEAYVKEKDGEKKYKLVLTTQEGESKELFADEEGNWIDKEGKKDDGVEPIIEK